MFINPRMAEMKNRAPLMEHYGHPAEERVILPAAYVSTLAFPKKESDRIRAKLTELAKPCQAEILSDRIAHHEWENRFKLMIVKRLGPSLVPAEVIVPLSKLGNVMAEIEDKVNQPIVKEGVVVRSEKDGKPEVVILGFIPSDQRKFSYHFVFGLVLTIVKIAEKYGGRLYASGMYFTKKVDSVIGMDRVKRIQDFKKKIDPKGILNPNKVLDGGLLGAFMTLSSVFYSLSGVSCATNPPNEWIGIMIESAAVTVIFQSRKPTALSSSPITCMI